MNSYFFMIFVFLSAFCFSQEWKLISTDDDMETYIRSHSENTAWIKTTNVDIETGVFESKIVKGQIVVLLKFDCENQKIGRLAEIQYDKDGEVLMSNQTKEILVDMEYPYPDSYSEFYLKTFCEKED